MNKLLQTAFLIIICSVTVLADWGFYDSDRSWIGIDFNGTGTSYRIYNNGTVSGDGYFNGSNLGNFTSSSQTLAISYWDVKTFKNSGSDVQQAQMYYRVYENGTGGGSFTQIVGGFIEDYGGGNQRWGKSSSTSIDVSSLTAGKTYKLEVYIQVYGTSPNEWKFDNNGTSNFIATFTTDAAFPVELSSFTAKFINNSILLNWKTTTEQNNYGFEVQRSEGSWSKIGFIAGSGNSNSTKNYSYTDNTVKNGKYSYRLKQIDNDGAYKYSDVVEVEVNNTPSVYSLEQNYPNPFNPSTTIKFSLPEAANVSLKVFNVLGQEIKTLVSGIKPAGEHSITFDAKELNSGLYFYKLETGSFNSVRKMLLTK